MDDVEAILFDCDGVLVDSEIVGLDEVVAFLRGHGLRHSREAFIRQFSGMRSDGFRKDLKVELDRTRAQPMLQSEFEDLFEEMISVRRAQRDQMLLVPDAAAMLETLRHAHPEMKVAVASSSGQYFLDDKIDRFGLRPFFGDHVYSADRVDQGKPSPDIFLYAAKRLGVDSGRCIVVEDSPHGVTAGVAAGATVWGFTGGGHCLADHGNRLVDVGATQILDSHQALGRGFGKIS